jgi:hypothetical protein
MRKLWIAAFAGIAMLAAGSAAAAEPDTQAFAKRLFGHDVAAKGKNYACFTRRYDAAHLRQHPQQKTTAMKALVSAEMVPESKQSNCSAKIGNHFDGMGGPDKVTIAYTARHSRLSPPRRQIQTWLTASENSATPGWSSTPAATQ